MSSKKIIINCLTLSFLIFGITIGVQAKTLSDLKDELQKDKNELKANQDKEQKTEAEMSSINTNIKSIQSTIAENYEKIKKLNNEIEGLNSDIKVKEAEIKKIVNFNQVSNGESAYLEYMFGAEDFTDFIYRTAVTEQLSSYNKELINEYNKKIDENKKKTEELDKQKNELAKKQKELEAQYSQLGSSLADMADIKVTLEDAIKQEEHLINEYKKMGCNEDEEFAKCVARINQLPPDTVFWRPLNSGRITSRFGYRLLYNKGNNHEGLDIGTPTGTPVYAIANGVVVDAYEVGTTGLAVYIRHNVNGRHYTSIYMHLSRYNVRLGDVVTKDSIIGYSGCTGGCTGPHLHLGLVSGYAGPRGDTTKDFKFWSSAFYANLIDPTTVVNFPSGHGSFSDRTTYFK